MNDLITTFEAYTELLQQWNMIILWTCVIGFWLAMFLNRFSNHGTKSTDNAPTVHFWQILIGVAFLLRVPLMFSQPWYDETYTWAMATANWSAFPPALLSDVHPPGFYMLSRLMVATFGMDIWALRFPSLIAGLILPWVVYRYSFAISSSHSTGRIAAVLVAILPQTIYYSTEARYPMLLALVVLLAMLAILDDKSLRFILLGALPVYLHSMGIFYAFLLAVGALLYRPSRRWLLAAALAGCVGALWIPGILIQSQIVGNGFWLLLDYPITYIVDMTSGRTNPSIYPLFVLWTIMFGLSFRRVSFQWDGGVILWLLIAVGTPALAWVVSLLWNPIYLPRALMASAILFLPLWADGLKQFRVLMVVGLLLLLPSHYALYTSDRAPISQVFDLCADSENIYATSNTMAIPAMYYLPDTPRTVWRASNEVDRTTELTPEIQTAFNIAIADNPDGLENVCIIAIIDPYTTQTESIELNRLASIPGTSLQMVDANKLYKFAVIRYES